MSKFTHVIVHHLDKLGQDKYFISFGKIEGNKISLDPTEIQETERLIGVQSLADSKRGDWAILLARELLCDEIGYGNGGKIIDGIDKAYETCLGADDPNDVPARFYLNELKLVLLCVIESFGITNHSKKLLLTAENYKTQGE